jgi:hypothetical protein
VHGAGGDPGDVQQHVDQLGHARHLRLHDQRHVGHGVQVDLVLRLPAQQPIEPVDLQLQRGQRGAQLVRRHGQELVAHLHRPA